MSQIRDSWECVQVYTGLTEYSNTLPFSFSFFLSFFLSFFSASQLHYWAIPVMHLRVSFKVKMQQQSNYEGTQRYYCLCSPPLHPIPLHPLDPERTGQWKATKAWHYHVKKVQGRADVPYRLCVTRQTAIEDWWKEKKKKKKKKIHLVSKKSKVAPATPWWIRTLIERTSFFFSPLSFFFFLSFFSSSF